MPLAVKSCFIFPGVAKFGIALEWGSRGRWFESSHSDQLMIIRTLSSKWGTGSDLSFTLRIFFKQSIERRSILGGCLSSLSSSFLLSFLPLPELPIQKPLAVQRFSVHPLCVIPLKQSSQMRQELYHSIQVSKLQLQRLRRFQLLEKSRGFRWTLKQPLRLSSNCPASIFAVSFSQEAVRAISESVLLLNLETTYLSEGINCSSVQPSVPTAAKR